MTVEGVHYEINWRADTYGRALVFPSLDPKQAWRDISPVLRRLQIKVVRKHVIDEATGVQGLRIWRV